MTIEMRRPGRPLLKSELDALEARLGRALPEDFRAFLLKQNGGKSIEYETTFFHRYLEKNQTLVIYNWAPVLPEPSVRSPTIEQGISNLGGLLPTGFIPIGESQEGLPALLSLNRENFGFIFVLDPEFPDQRSISVVARSFTEFVDSLKPHV